MRHEAHGLRARPLRDFVARAPTSRSACGGALQKRERENSVQVNLTLFSLSRFAERTRFELVVQVAPYVGLANQCTEKISAKIFLHYTASSKSL